MPTKSSLQKRLGEFNEIAIEISASLFLGLFMIGMLAIFLLVISMVAKALAESGWL